MLRKISFLFFTAILLSVASARAQNAPATECDSLAGHPNDPQRKAPGLSPDKINAATAVPACEAAVRQYPTDLRLIFQLGRAYEAAKNYPGAIAQYQKAADQNYAPAENSLGFDYVLGVGIAKDDDKALAWFRKSADLGFAPGQSNLATMYQQGKGVAKNSQEALKWYRLAAAQKV